MKEGSSAMNNASGGNAEGGKGSVVAQVPSPSATSQQPNPNANLDSPLIK